MLTVTWLSPVSVRVTVPIEPEIPRLFALKLYVIEFADAIGVMARAAAINKTDAAIFKLVILTGCFSLKRSRLMNDLVVARRMPSGGYLGNFKKYMYVFENKSVLVAKKNGDTATFLFTCENICS
jgi:hypothetical protein